jgi:predicted CoA-binding protein
MMTKKSDIDDFIAHKSIVVVGASRSPRKFGNIVLRGLKSRGYRVLAVNPNASEVEGLPCYPDLASLPEKPDGAVFIVQPGQTALTAKAAVDLGVNWIWMQPGSESAEAIQYCREKGVSLVHGECILMFLENNAFIHRVHRFLKQVTGSLYTAD